MRMPHFEIFRKFGARWGRLLDDYTFEGSLTGHQVVMTAGPMAAKLEKFGELRIYALSEWDFGTCAVDDLAMIRASLEHDFYCTATHTGLLPWRVRYKADKLFFRRLGEAGATISRFWRTPLVMLNSQTLAKWRRLR